MLLALDNQFEGLTCLDIFGRLFDNDLALREERASENSESESQDSGHEHFTLILDSLALGLEQSAHSIEGRL